jgi:hypothetical protein
MPGGISKQGKDIIYKILTHEFKDKSFSAIGLDVPKVKEFLIADFPYVIASEIRADNIFLLEDDSVLVVDFESDIKKSDYVKYLGYIYAVLNHYLKTENILYNIIMAVIYTGDGKTSDKRTDNDIKFGNVDIKLTHVPLSRFDTDVLYNDLKQKMDAGEELTDEDIMRFIILPVTESNKSERQNTIEKTIDLAKKIPDERQQAFAISGILVSTNNFIDKTYAEKIKEWLSMTKIGRLYEEEKINFANQEVSKARLGDRIALVKKMLAEGEDIIKIMKYTELTKDEILKILEELNLPDAI